MKKQDFELLVRAASVMSVTILNSSDDFEGWEIWFYFQDRSEQLQKNVIKTSRGETRLFKTLDAAYSFIVSCGFSQVVYIDGDN